MEEKGSEATFVSVVSKDSGASGTSGVSGISGVSGVSGVSKYSANPSENIGSEHISESAISSRASSRSRPDTGSEFSSASNYSRGENLPKVILNIEDVLRKRSPADMKRDTTSSMILMVMSLIIGAWLTSSLYINLYWNYENFGGFNDSVYTNYDVMMKWHYSVSIGVPVFSGLAILAFTILKCCGRTIAALVHTLFQILAILTCTVTVYVAFKDRQSYYWPHIMTPHSYIGVSTMGMYLLQAVFGVFTYFHVRIRRNIPPTAKTFLTPVHSAAGVVTFILALAACGSGLENAAIFHYGEEYRRKRRRYYDVQVQFFFLVVPAIYILVVVLIQILKNHTPGIYKPIITKRPYEAPNNTCC